MTVLPVIHYYISSKMQQKNALLAQSASLEIQLHRLVIIVTNTVSVVRALLNLIALNVITNFLTNQLCPKSASNVLRNNMEMKQSTHAKTVMLLASPVQEMELTNVLLVSPLWLSLTLLPMNVYYVQLGSMAQILCNLALTAAQLIV